MHIHSRYSDGSLWPAQIVERASPSIQALCLTDHDTLGGVPEFLEAAKTAGLQAWPAVEIDCVDQVLGYKSEVLAYFPSGRYEATDALVSGYRKHRKDRIQAALARARTMFHKPELDFSQLLDFRLSAWPEKAAPPDLEALRFAKTDIFYALKRAGVLPRGTPYRTFRKTYYDSGLFSDIKTPRPEIEELARAVTEDRGVMVIPHLGHEFGDNPLVLASRLMRLRRWLKRFKELGIEGIELYRYRTGSSRILNELIHREAKDLGFFFTYGSDCHGPDSGKDSKGRHWGEFEGFPERD